jgi:putative PEP-CTERM system TPR-repeat lipoprotein
MPSHQQPLSIAIMSATLLAGGLVACGKSQDAQALVGEARAYHKNGDYKAAVIELKNALQKSPGDPHARLLLGMVYLDANDAQSAEKELRKAMEMGMAGDQVMAPLFKALLIQGKFEKVLAEANGAPDHVTTAVARGNAYLGLGKSKEAKAVFDQARARSPGHPDVLIGLARLALMSQDIELASRYANEATSSNPSNADAWNFKADLARSQNKTDEALAAYGKVLNIKPNAAPVLVARAGVEISTGKYGAARASLEAALKGGAPTIIGLYTQALLEYKEGKYAAALERLQIVLRSAPEHMPSQLLAGSTQYALGATQQAEAHLKNYLDHYPKDIAARKMYAAAMLKNGAPKRAQAVAAEALKDAPKDPQLLAIAGESSWQARDLPAAGEYFKQASAIVPQDAILHASLGKTKLEQGDSDAAVAEFEKAYALDKKSDQAGAALALSYVRQKRFDKALELLNVMQKEQPKNVNLHLLKAAAHLARKDAGSARKSFEEARAIDPLNYPALASLANLDVQEGKPEVAKQRLQTQLEKQPKNTQLMQALGSLAAQQNQGGEATRWFERAHSESPDAMPAAAQLFMQYVRNGQQQKALALAQKLQSANPQSAEALDMLANAHFVNGNRDAALDAYEKLAVLKPDAAIVHYRLGILLLSGQKQPQAMAVARKLEQQFPDSPAGYTLEGDVLMAQQKPEQASDAFERAYAVSKNGQVVQKLHAALVQAGKEKMADTHIKQWLRDHPFDRNVHAYLAQHYLLGGQNLQAIRHYEALVQADPKDVSALNNLAWAYQLEKDSRALKTAESAYALEPRNPAVLDTLGGILVDGADLPRGLALFKLAVAGAPDSPEIRLRYAQSLLKAGDKAKARSELKTLVDSGKDFPKLKDARALLGQL